MCLVWKGPHAELSITLTPRHYMVTGQLPARWQPGYIFSAEAQPSGSLVATACSDGVLRVWDCQSGQMQHVCSVPQYRGMTAACAWDAEGHCIASVATNGEIVVLV